MDNSGFSCVFRCPHCVKAALSFPATQSQLLLLGDFCFCLLAGLWTLEVLVGEVPWWKLI